MSNPSPSLHAGKVPEGTIDLHAKSFNALRFQETRFAIVYDARGLQEEGLYRITIKDGGNDGEHILARLAAVDTVRIKNISALRLKMLGYESKSALLRKLKYGEGKSHISEDTLIAVLQLKDMEYTPPQRCGGFLFF